MDKSQHCDVCKVDVSSDLRYCPLCGKFMSKKGDQKPQRNEKSYPDYDFSYIHRAKTIRIISDILLLAGLLVVIINLLAWTQPLWFPYVLASLLAFYMVLVFPFRSDENYLSSVPISVVVISLFIIFIDSYGFLTRGFVFGYSIAYVAPGILSLGSLVCGLFGLFSNRYDIVCLKGILTLNISAFIFLVIKLAAFKHFVSWPTVAFFAMSFGFLAMILIFKHKKFIKEMNKKFHI